jgi:hypothetical protein
VACGEHLDILPGSMSRCSPHTDVETFSGNNDIVRDIGNGLFLNTSLHCVLGKYVAFLKVRQFDLMLHLVRNWQADSFSEQTPNFAMDATDIASNAERFTSHLVDQHVTGPSGSVDRIPSDMSIWPPTALFDLVQWCITLVLHHNDATRGAEHTMSSTSMM